MKKTLLSVLPIALVFAVLFFLLSRNLKTSSENSIKVITYSAFLNSWGPGPIIAQKFHDLSGINVDFINGGEANVLFQKMELFDSDLVLGVDQFAIANSGFSLNFQPIDWSPMTFVYRKSSGIAPPKSLDDLLDKRFAGKISLSDPRTSTPGLQFLLWVLKEKGEKAGFEFLKKLKPNIAFVGPSWSASYGNFKKSQSEFVFSYLASPVYHWVEEKNFDYQPAPMSEQVKVKLPLQIEYAAISPQSKHPEIAQAFLDFLVSDEIQSLIMQKNFMLPVNAKLVDNTPFAQLPKFSIPDFTPEAPVNDLPKILDRWQDIGL